MQFYYPLTSFISNKGFHRPSLLQYFPHQFATHYIKENDLIAKDLLLGAVHKLCQRPKGGGGGVGAGY